MELSNTDEVSGEADRCLSGETGDCVDAGMLLGL